MTEDIVTRLRNWAPCWALHDHISIDLNQGADEIERLRSTVTDCRIEIERLTAERDEANANAKLYRDDRDRMSKQLLEEQRQ